MDGLMWYETTKALLQPAMTGLLPAGMSVNLFF